MFSQKTRAGERIVEYKKLQLLPQAELFLVSILSQFKTTDTVHLYKFIAIPSWTILTHMERKVNGINKEEIVKPHLSKNF